VEHDRASGVTATFSYLLKSAAVPNRDRVALGDLKPLEMPAHQSLRGDLTSLSDDELLASIESPSRGDGIVINTRTGVLYDGNGRVYELLRRATGPGSSITRATLVPVEYYTPNYSMFPDMDPAGPP
jgi:hypothetical protein